MQRMLFHYLVSIYIFPQEHKTHGNAQEIKKETEKRECDEAGAAGDPASKSYNYLPLSLSSASNYDKADDNLLGNSFSR